MPASHLEVQQSLSINSLNQMSHSQLIASPLLTSPASQS
jgi:hypothetical protein